MCLWLVEPAVCDQSVFDLLRLTSIDVLTLNESSLEYDQIRMMHLPITMGVRCRPKTVEIIAKRINAAKFDLITSRM